MSLDRRSFLMRGLVGCSLAASPLFTPVTLASAPWDNRLVVIILRGGMDGLDVVQPYGDPALAGLRKTLRFGEAGQASDLDGFYALHPKLRPLMPLWKAQELSFAHAVSTPYRDGRSHFDGQDLLEAGAGDVTASPVRDGWLNRMLQVIPGLEAETSYAVGRDEMLLMAGTARVSRWSPEADLDLSPQAKRLIELVYHDDAPFRDAVSEALQIVDALDIEAEASGDTLPKRKSDENGQGSQSHKTHQVAAFTASRLRESSRVAAFSINGWDTHAKQAGALGRALGQLSQAILTLKDGLGSVWGKTTVLAMTEFGRTARENGTRGTDHGTGGAMLMAGGAIRGGQVFTDWPGLDESGLYQRRDLMPTRDVRAYAGWAMRGMFGLDANVLTSSIFPGVDLGSDPKLIL